MKRKFYKAMMKFTYRMASRSKKRLGYWCRCYTEWAERCIKEGGAE